MTRQQYLFDLLRNQDPLTPEPTPTVYAATPVPETAMPAASPQAQAAAEAATATAYAGRPYQNQGTFTNNIQGTPVPAVMTPQPAQAVSGPTAGVPATPVSTQTPTPTPTPEGTPTPNEVVWQVGFQEGFNAGFDAAQGRQTQQQSAIANHDESYNSAFNYGFQQGFAAGSGQTPSGVTPETPSIPQGGSMLGINAAQAAGLWMENPALAITLGGPNGEGAAATYGTPGYETLAGFNFHPQSIMMAAGMSTADPVNNWQTAMDLYHNMGRVGGSMPNASALLTNMAYASPDSEFGAEIIRNPVAFYDVGMQVMQASGASPYAIQAFDQQMKGMYVAYDQYLITTGSDAAVLPFNAWLVQNHPDVVASWSS